MAGRHALIVPRGRVSASKKGAAAAASVVGMLVGMGSPMAFADQNGRDDVAPAAQAEDLAAQPVTASLNTQGGEWQMEWASIEAEAAPEAPVAAGSAGRAAAGGAQAATAAVDGDYAPSAAGSSVLGTALAYTGVPYVWGGTTPSGWDCIGFVRFVYAQHGISIGPVTTSVLSAGRQVPYSQVQPGDILYWPGHVGISLGNGQNVAAWNPEMGTRVGSDLWAGTPTVIRVG